MIRSIPARDLKIGTHLVRLILIVGLLLSTAPVALARDEVVDTAEPVLTGVAPDETETPAAPTQEMTGPAITEPPPSEVPVTPAPPEDPTATPEPCGSATPEPGPEPSWLPGGDCLPDPAPTTDAQIKDAIAALTGALAAYERSCREAQNEIGVVAMRLEQSRLVLADIKASAKLTPEQKTTLEQLVNMAKDKFDSAMTHIKEALKQCTLAKKNAEEAKKKYEEALQKMGDDRETLVAAAEKLWEQAAGAEAERLQLVVKTTARLQEGIAILDVALKLKERFEK